MGKVVVLTGAGISAESGLKTFRDNNGLWEDHRVEEVTTPEAFAVNPDLVYRFYNLRRAQLQSPEVKPNAAHLALAKLEKKLGKNLLVVTQNVDNLHEQAGSKNVLHMHGELLSAKCCKTGKSQHWTQNLDQSNGCKCCYPARRMRPDIVWFGEMPYYMDEIQEALYQADLFIAIGTSGHVYPAAGFVAQAASYGCQTVEINLEPSAVGSEFEQQYYGLASEQVPKFLDTL
ncbi:Sir2 family NAD+-dependent deacetylase [Planctobacterium marinum]|uniref:Sir2 family NAD+-dependent deacetylase n=1 Tax=Planctobacterium marinum TaxID=1631968 RepID=UPI001E6020DF|nr:NAD-dependent protein deacylase [Planctobacterium marinum]